MNETGGAGGASGMLGGGRFGWRPVFGLTAAVVGLVVVVALVAHGLMPAPSPSSVVGPSSTPSSSAYSTPTGEPTPSPTSIATPAPTGTTTPSPAATPAQKPLAGLRPTGAMSPALSRTTATRLADGRVLIAGGMYKPKGGSVAFKTELAEIYNPATGKFTQTGSMAEARVFFTATLLRNGRVLVVGGADLMDGIDNLATAELYEPATGKFTPAGSMAQGRSAHTATLLSDGRVLIAGGYGGGTSPLRSAEIYDPATGKFTSTGAMETARSGHTAVRLTSGRVLVAGGQTDVDPGVTRSTEVYEPSTGTFEFSLPMTTPRYGHAATLLGNGRMLIAGGRDETGRALGSAQVYVQHGVFGALYPMSVAGDAMAVALADGRALVVVGRHLELYDPPGNFFGFSPAGEPGTAADTATLLADGSVLLTEGGPAQLYQP